MNKGLGALGIQRAIIRYQIKESFLILSATVILPILIHTIPQYGSLPWGARILPIYYAPFVAIMFFKPHVGILSAVLAPFLNTFLTGSPDFKIAALLTVELLMFTLTSSFVYLRWPHFKSIAPLAYLVSKIISLTFFIFPVSLAIGQSSAIPFFLDSLKAASPGIAILFAINIWLVRIKDNTKD